MISHSSGPVVCDRRKRLVREHPCGGPLGRAGKTLPQRVAPTIGQSSAEGRVIFPEPHPGARLKA